MATAIEKKVGEVVTVTANTVDPDGNPFANLPTVDSVDWVSTNAGVAYVTPDPKDPTSATVTCIAPGSTVIQCELKAGLVDIIDSLAIAVVGQAPGPDKEAARLRTASLSLVAT